MDREIRVGLCGCGVIGGGVVTVLRQHADVIAKRAGGPVVLSAVADKDPARLKAVEAPGQHATDDAFDVLGRDDVDIVVELIGGTTIAKKVVQAALEHKKHVVTANKALLADHGAELFQVATTHDCDLYFEAAVAGGIPVIRAIRESFSSDKIRSLRGIINGTSNYILSEMATGDAAFEVALKGAQEAGFAEADPTLDITGGDAGHKLAILAGLAFGAQVSPKEIPTEGIDTIEPRDVRYASEFGYVIRPLAVGEMRDDGSLDLRVHPALVPTQHPLAHVEGALNAVAIQGEMVGPSFLSGLGAGAGPTATSVVADIVDIARNMRQGSPARSWPQPQQNAHQLNPITDLESQYYLRLSARDETGVLGSLSSKLGEFGISIEKMVQDESHVAGSASVVILTHKAREGRVRDAIRAIDQAQLTTAATAMLRIVD